jgi:hypothetical protein
MPTPTSITKLELETEEGVQDITPIEIDPEMAEYLAEIGRALESLARQFQASFSTIAEIAKSIGSPDGT